MGGQIPPLATGRREAGHGVEEEAGEGGSSKDAHAVSRELHQGGYTGTGPLLTRYSSLQF